MLFFIFRELRLMRKMKAGRISKEEFEKRIKDFDPEDL